jgi:hypothetical protein
MSACLVTRVEDINGYDFLVEIHPWAKRQMRFALFNAKRMGQPGRDIQITGRVVSTYRVDVEHDGRASAIPLGQLMVLDESWYTPEDQGLELEVTVYRNGGSRLSGTGYTASGGRFAFDFSPFVRVSSE